VVPPLLADDVWSHVPEESPVFLSVFIFVGVVSNMSLSIYSFYHRRWLLLWCACSWSLHDDFSFYYYDKLYYSKFYLAPVMEER
jgi:hypothetical protein